MRAPAVLVVALLLACCQVVSGWAVVACRTCVECQPVAVVDPCCDHHPEAPEAPEPEPDDGCHCLWCAPGQATVPQPSAPAVTVAAAPQPAATIERLLTSAPLRLVPPRPDRPPGGPPGHLRTTVLLL